MEITFRLALLIALLLKEERYTCVTFSELCPSPSLIMAMATPSSLAVVAQLWRALYNADIFVEIDAIKIIDNNEYQ